MTPDVMDARSGGRESDVRVDSGEPRPGPLPGQPAPTRGGSTVAALAGAAAAQPARAVQPGRGVDAAPELRRDGTLRAEQGDAAPPRRAPRYAAARAQRAAPRGWLRPGLPGVRVRRSADGGGTPGGAAAAPSSRAVPSGRRRPALGPRRGQP